MVQHRPPKYRRLKAKQKRAIITLHKTGEWNGRELANLFGITAGRVSQLVRDTYNEREALGIGREEFAQ